MRIVVTGADGFVGRSLVPRLLDEGHDVVAAVRPDQPPYSLGRPPQWEGTVATVPLELTDEASVRGALTDVPDAVVHLAALASGGDASRQPDDAWQVNAAGTARLAEVLGREMTAGAGAPLLLLASTGEVYGAGPRQPRKETDATEPCSPYGASKLAAERAALEVYRRTGLRVVIARAFPHTGRDQDDRFVVPAFARRLVEAKRTGATSVRVGNLTPVREFLHVSDVAEAYARLLERGEAGEVYNVASGEGATLQEVFDMLVEIVDHRVRPEADADLMRPADIPYLVGDASKLRERTGWEPRRSLRETLTEVVDAQAD